MARAALTKLFLLVILAFIICLPEFFTLYRVKKVSFFCRPYRPCERVHQVKKGENVRAGNAEAKRAHVCDPSQTPDQEKWERACTQEDESNTTDSASDFRGDRDDPKLRWFVCETDMEMAELHRNISTSAHELHLEVSAELQLPNAETLNLTLYGRSNYSSLHLYPPEEKEEEEKEEDVGNHEGQGKAFYCCLPLVPTSKSANQSRCLLWFANQTLWNSTAKEKLPWKRTQKDEWQCVLRVVWLALLCLVLLSIVTSVIGQIYRGKRTRRNTKVHPVGYSFTAQQLNEGDKQREVSTPEGTNLHAYGFHSWPGLSPIKEVESENDTDMLMDGNVDHCYTANLHHRSHPSVSSIKE
ncbi:uncharacterized protein LOC115781839 isoform X2 [Archocentrus centrarchus]|uniref:uncharacterized protein LOC115781839 isoform X2 n=1 Tax=Archocentrus centrarchus TaxID=63155 RepID=UPI0011EA1508|nr:uncharacterized protein LOC115781839 isoform X2 [Archocentrus centrarchus]